MLQQTEANVSHSNLSTTVTCEHANSVLSSTCLQSIVGGGEPEEPLRGNPATAGPMTSEDLGGAIASPGAVLPGIQRPVLCTTKSWRGPSTTSLSDVPSAPSSPRICTSYKRVSSLPSYVGLTGTSRTCGINASGVSYTDSPSTSVP
jgi:hypothetical protein